MNSSQETQLRNDLLGLRTAKKDYQEAINDCQEQINNFRLLIEEINIKINLIKEGLE